MSGRELVPRRSHGLEVKSAAEAIHRFLKSTIGEVEGAVVSLDRDQLLLYMEAFKSDYFMRLIEEDPDLPYDVKVQVSHMVSGLSKGWTAIQMLVFDPSALRFAAVAWQMSNKVNQIVDALGIQVVIPSESRELQPEELPPGFKEDDEA